VNASHHRSLLELACAPAGTYPAIGRPKLRAAKREPSASLHFKKIGDLWSARIGINYRAVAVEDGADFIWVWIGPHDEYQRMSKQQG